MKNKKILIKIKKSDRNLFLKTMIYKKYIRKIDFRLNNVQFIRRKNIIYKYDN